MLSRFTFGVVTRIRCSISYPSTVLSSKRFGAASINFQRSDPFTTSKSKMSPKKGDKEDAENLGNKSADLEGKENEWKFKTPYRVHETSDGFKAIYEASCHCGRVRYELDAEKPVDAKYCHCTTCQKLHGACFQWAAIFHKENINFTHGHHDLTWYDSQEKTTRHKLPCKVSCEYCHTPIMDEGRKMILLFPSLINFKSADDRRKFAPSCHMFYGQRLVDIPDGKPKWTGIDGKSDLIEDSPAEAVEKRKRELEQDDHASGEESAKKQK